MKRFNDIKQEVCSPIVHYTPDCPSSFSPCSSKPEAFLRLYRNFWGVYSDTQIRYLEETGGVNRSGLLGPGFIITGRYCNVPGYFFELFINKVIGHNVVVPRPMYEILKDFNMCAEYVMYNGQVAILLRSLTDEEKAKIPEDYECLESYLKLQQDDLTEKPIRVLNL